MKKIYDNLIGIVCTDQNCGIGHEGTIPWFMDAEVSKQVKMDLTNFKTLTWGNTVIVGKITYLHMPQLHNRIVSVLTHDDTLKLHVDDCKLSNLDELEILLQNRPTDTFYVCGGESVYKQLLPYCKYLYLSVIHKEYKCDAYLDPMLIGHFNQYETIYTDELIHIEKMENVDG